MDIASTMDPEKLKRLASGAELTRPATSITRSKRFDVYLFFSFDLVGSTKLKLKNYKNRSFTWLDVIKHFYFRCKTLMEDLGIEDAKVWKYIGDEVLFYKRIADPNHIERSVSGVFRALDMYEKELRQHHAYGDIAKDVSVKGTAWISPIQSYQNSSIAAHSSIAAQNAFNTMRERFEGDDEMIKSEQAGDNPPLDFLGPNIDSGFRIAKFSRKKQLVLSAALAYYLYHKGYANNLRIVDVSELKGIAEESLYPIIWYNENWNTIRQQFSYEERLEDPLIRYACAGEHEPITLLTEEIRQHFKEKKHGYFFEPEILDEIIAVSNRRDE